MTDAQIAKFLFENSYFMVQNNLFYDFGRMVMWGLVTGLKWIVEQCENLYNIVFKMVDFTTWGQVGEFVTSLRGVFTAIMVLSLVALGFILILNPEKKPNILINVLIAGAVITSSSLLLNDFNKLAIAGKEAILGNENTTNASSTIINNMYDLIYIDKVIGLKNFTEENAGTTHYDSLSDKELRVIDIGETINYKSDYITTSEAKDILKKKLIYIQDQNIVGDVYNGMGWNSADDNDLLNEFYYRYKVDYFPIIISFIALLLVYIFMSYKVFRIIYELAIAHVLAVIYSADLTGGQKTIKILHYIKDSYIVLILTALLIKFYYIMEAYLTTNVSQQFVRCILILFLAFTVIDGPALIEKLTGIDAGLSGGAGKMMATVGIMRGAMAMGSGIKNIATGGATRAMKQAWKQQHADAAAQTDALREFAGSGSSSSFDNTNQNEHNGNATNNQQAHNQQTNNQQGTQDNVANVQGSTNSQDVTNAQGSTNTQDFANHPGTPNLESNTQEETNREMLGGSSGDTSERMRQDTEANNSIDNDNMSALNGFNPKENSFGSTDTLNGLSQYESNSELFHEGEGFGNHGAVEYTDDFMNNRNNVNSESESLSPQTQNIPSVESDES